MKIYKYEYQYDTHRNREWFDLASSHTEYYSKNTPETRADFIRVVGKDSSEFLMGIPDKYVGYKITEVDVREVLND